MKKRILIGLVVAVALGLIIMGSAQAVSLVLVDDLGCADLAYKWYSNCDHTNGMITASPNHLLPSGGSWLFEFDGDPGFKSVMVGTSEQYTTFTADLRGGAVLTISWSPGYSGWEQLEATLDGNTILGRQILAGGNNGQPDARLGAPGDLWYFTEVFEFGALTDGSHTLTIRSLNGNGVGFDYIKLEAVPIEVVIDIKPGSDPNCFNVNGHGVIPVAILSTTDFDAPSEVDPETVMLGGMAIRMRGKSDKYLAHAEDVNSDGLADLVVQIEDSDGTLAPGHTTATLEGYTYGGLPIVGSDSICIVP